jgi:hypothetical protein
VQLIYLTGDLHGGLTSYHITSREFLQTAKQGDIVICLGDVGGVWYHDYHSNDIHKGDEDRFLETTLSEHLLWLAVDGNHENFSRLYGGEFPVVDLFGGQAYRIRKNVYYLKRGEIFTIEGHTFFAFGGAASIDKEPGWYMPPMAHYGYGGREWNPGRTHGIDWWPEETPDRKDYLNACHNLDKIGWHVDHVITHTCPSSRRAHFIVGSHTQDPTEFMLQELFTRITFNTWHFGHLHLEKQVDNFYCHFDSVRPLSEFLLDSVSELSRRHEDD